VEIAAIDLVLRRGVLELARSEANPTLRRRLFDAPLDDADRDTFVALLDRFERLWFRDGRAEHDHYAAWQAFYDRLLARRAGA
jgi:hypothetical protein